MGEEGGAQVKQAPTGKVEGTNASSGLGAEMVGRSLLGSLQPVATLMLHCLLPHSQNTTQ